MISAACCHVDAPWVPTRFTQESAAQTPNLTDRTVPGAPPAQAGLNHRGHPGDGRVLTVPSLETPPARPCGHTGKTAPNDRCIDGIAEGAYREEGR